jgi:hypothetical protein
VKKASTLLAALVALNSSALIASAQTALEQLGTSNFTVDGGSTTASYSQTSTNLTLNSPFAFGDTLGGVFASAADWSAYSDTNSYAFGLFMSAPGASPGIGFTVEFYNGALDTIVNAYQGVAAGLSTTPSFVSVALSAPGSDDFSSIGGLQFTWDSPGSGTVVVDSVGVALVPEPTTWAMLVFGALLIGGLALRRRLAVARS